MDQFYTPPGLARLLVDAARAQEPTMIADFAMGDGALLRAAQERWPGAKLFGSDIDPKAIAGVKGIDERLGSATHNFLGDEPEPEALSAVRGGCDVVVLNPPFTCRGNLRFPVRLGDRTHRASKALAFVAKALSYLSSKGEILAIVPASCLTSERDRELLVALRGQYGLEQIGEIARNAFSGRAVSVVIIRLRRLANGRRAIAPLDQQKLVPLRSFSAEVMRGSLPVQRATGMQGNVPYIHTCDLRSGALAASGRGVTGSTRGVQGEVLLLPRVGRPNSAKLVLANVPLSAALSDCVIAVRTTPAGHEGELHRLLKANWSRLASAYGGSCAPYLTLSDLDGVLRTIGVISVRVEDMRERGGAFVSQGSAIRRRAEA